MKYSFIILITFFSFCNATNGQDTFSIVALDSTSRQVGSAGAGCLDLAFAGFTNPAFLADLLPDTGVVNTQSYYVKTNQDNARARMRLGETPAQIINWLVANDANNNPEFKQYGIVGFTGGIPSGASHTGSSCINYKNHIIGNIHGFYYAIQGNILKGQEILDSMETGFRNTQGNLACRLMAAMQGANVVGADTRCMNKNTSSLFGFLQVALPTDTYGQPSLSLTFASSDTAPMEPIDTLQTMLNATNWCIPASVHTISNERIHKYNYTGETLHILPNFLTEYSCKLIVTDMNGCKVLENTISKFNNQVNTNSLPFAIYYYIVYDRDKIFLSGRYTKK